MPIYDKPVRLLMRDMVDDIQLKSGDIIEREQIIDWFATHYPLIKIGTVSGHLVLLSTNDPSRLNHNPSANKQSDLFFRIGTGRYRLYEPLTDPKPIVKGSVPTDEGFEVPEPVFEPEQSKIDSEFAYEHDLRDYLAKNLHLIEPGLKLYHDEGISGIEFPVGGRFIDILAVDAQDGYVVVELKVSKGHDRVVGQLLRYVGWIRKNQAEPNQKVRGVIIANTITEDILLACSELQNVALFEYSLSVSLRSVASN